jgi:hypothetical protein
MGIDDQDGFDNFYKYKKFNFGAGGGSSEGTRIGINSSNGTYNIKSSMEFDDYGNYSYTSKIFNENGAYEVTQCGTVSEEGEYIPEYTSTELIVNDGVDANEWISGAMGALSEIGGLALDGVGMVPGPVGVAANILSAGLSVYKGDYAQAGLGLLGAALGGVPIAKVISRALKSEWTVYKGVEAGTDLIKYVGITSRDVNIRFIEHLRKGGEWSLLNYEAISKTSYFGARKLEQKIINEYGINNLLNKRNSIRRIFWSSYGIE